MRMADPLPVTKPQHDPGETDHPAEELATGEDLAAILTRLLEEVPGKTQKDLATEAGISYPTLNAWMNRSRGTTRIAPDTLRALSDALRRWGADVTPAQLFASVGRPVPGPASEEREQRLLDIYRTLSVKGQRALIEHGQLLQRLERH